MRLAEFLNLYSNPNTKKTYVTGIKHFLNFVYNGNGTRSLKDYDRLSGRYLGEKRDHFRDLLAFTKEMGEAGAPKTARAYIGGVREWLQMSGVEFNHVQKKQLRHKTPPNAARTMEAVLDREVLKKILAHLDAKGRALILVMASSGMRLGEALQLRPEDVDLNTAPAKIEIRQENTKNRRGRITFISSEATEALKEWLKVRQGYLGAATNRNRGLVEAGRAKEKAVEDDRLFPFTSSVAERIWTLALEKAGLDERDRGTNRRKVRLHATRKFFRSQLALAVPPDIAEALMGHEGYLTGAYRRYSEKELAEYYLKGEVQLVISAPKGLVEIGSEVKKGLDRNRELLEEYILENKGLKRSLDEQRTTTEKLQEASQLLVPFIQALSDQEVVERARQARIPDKIYSEQIPTSSLMEDQKTGNPPSPIALLRKRYLELVGSWTRSQVKEAGRP